MKAGAFTLADASRLQQAQRAATAAGRLLRRRTRLTRLPWPLSAWTEARDAPAPPEETFRQWWTRTHDGDARHGDATRKEER